MPQKPTVLLIDDDADIRDTFGAALEDAGFVVVTADTGAAGLDLLRTGLRPNVIVLDQMMPRVNGREFRALQLSDPNLANVPVVLMTASMKVQPLVDAIAPTAVLRKPVGYTELLVAIKSALHAAPTAPTTPPSR